KQKTKENNELHNSSEYKKGRQETQIVTLTSQNLKEEPRDTNPDKYDTGDLDHFRPRNFSDRNNIDGFNRLVLRKKFQSLDNPLRIDSSPTLEAIRRCNSFNIPTYYYTYCSMLLSLHQDAAPALLFAASNLLLEAMQLT